MPVVVRASGVLHGACRRGSGLLAVLGMVWCVVLATGVVAGSACGSRLLAVLRYVTSCVKLC